MTTKRRFNLQIESTKSLFKPSDFLNAVQLHYELLPELLPKKCGWFGPLEKTLTHKI